MTTAQEKGDALELAVRGIEAAILRSSPALRENTFRMEGKKIIVVGGVHHEIDVHVEVDMGREYKAIFIFECKNWRDAVGKNEIIVFSEKVAAANAQKGFFVAKSFTRDAEAQAAKDSRMELLHVAEYPADATPIPFSFHYIFQDRDKMVSTLQFVEVGTELSEGVLDIATVNATRNGGQFNLLTFVNDWINEAVNANLNSFQSQILPQGVYKRSLEAERIFGSGELTINGKEICRARLQTRLPVNVIRPTIVSHFEVTTRGRSITFEPVQFGGAMTQVVMSSVSDTSQSEPV
jgi:hypothetical protein